MNADLVALEFVNEVAILTVDNPPVNTINIGVRKRLMQRLDEIEARRDTRAVVLMCAGKTFFSGADISEFSGPPQEEAYRALFNRIEALPVPVVAAMHGTVLGGGLEIALACHYRIARKGARFGLPEITLGIIPGAGGTQRMPRIIGVEKTLELVMSARPVDAEGAQSAGFVDAVFEGDVRTAALEYVDQLLAQDRGARPTSALRVDPASATPEIIARFRDQAARQYPNREAPLTAIDAISAAACLSLADGLEYETRLANEAKATVESRALVHVFFAERATRKIPDLPPDIEARPVARGAVVGSGTMGGGIAIAFANAGLPVTVLDSSEEALDKGLAVVDRTYESMVRRGRITAEEKAQRLALIEGTLDYAGLDAADVIIEAAPERMDLKQQIFARLDAVAKPGAVLATNTSTLDIAEIAAAVKRPEDVIGLHFFAPANVMPLLEVIRTDRTSAATIRTAMELSRPLRKTPVLARVCYGFIGNRMMEGYAREAQRIVLEGETPRRVDEVLEHWGMAMGILTVFDMAGIDVGVNVHRSNADRYPPDPTYYQADFALHAAGRLGQKTGRGYYRYEPGDRRRHDDPEALEILRATAARLEIPARAHDDEESLERCLYPLINDGIRILEEGIAIRGSDIDVVWTSGYGFPRYRGGPLFYADTIGLKTVYDAIVKYRSIYGPMHWEPAPLLERLVAEGRSLAQWEAARRMEGE
jgi:3-hydroxyacyl-CoA dehydrogenase